MLLLIGWEMLCISSMVLNFGKYSPGDYLVMIIMATIPIIILYFKISRKKKKDNYHDSTNMEHNSRKDRNTISITPISNKQHNAPNKTLKYELESTLGILNDCYELMAKTKNVDTFFSRHVLALEKLDILRECVEQGIISDAKYYELFSKINECYNSRVNDFNKLGKGQNSNSVQSQKKLIAINSDIFNVVMEEKEVPDNREVLIKGVNLPDDVKELLWVKGKNYSDNENNMVNEPSLIDTTLPIRHMVLSVDIKESIGYYPSYDKLSPEQRYMYLKWLEDVTNTEIDIGYVFIFYYGLERHLLHGRFEKAVNMINRLRMNHKNSSFLAYSSDALLISAFMHRRIDLIEKINLETSSRDLATFVIGALVNKYSSYDLIRIRKSVGFTNDRYVKNQYDLFLQELDSVLVELYGEPYYKVYREDFYNCTDKFVLAMANYSLKFDNRFVYVPDITSNEEFAEKALMLFMETHERVKQINRKNRKKKELDT